MNLFEKARNWLPGMVQAAAGETVTYARGAEAITLTAVLGQTTVAGGVEGASRIVVSDRDYLIKVADLTFGVPAVGDRITATVNGEAVAFTVQDLESGEPAWRYSDPARTTWRIHVKQKR